MLDENARVLTLVFTDLVDSTALKTERGDDAVDALVTRHREHVKGLAESCVDQGFRPRDELAIACTHRHSVSPVRARA